MFSISRFHFFIIGACLVILLPQAAEAALYNANAVLGQTNFTSSTASTTQSGLSSPNGITFDSATNRLFVADNVNSRIMVFDAATSTITNGENAINVLGQTNFTSSTASTTQHGLNTPNGITFDPATNRLFVTDRSNKRIMVFDAATSTIANGENAVNVLGQSDFISATAATTQNGLNSPAGAALDTTTNRIFIADKNINRVMIFDAATATIANGENAANVLGQTSFTSSTVATTQSGFANPLNVAFDSATNRLFVAELSNRVMVFDVSTSTIANGENAINVLGQANFTSSTAARTQSRLDSPNGLAFDPTTKRLFVADASNNRIMVFDAATSTITNGENALNVLGQASFTSSAVGPTQSLINLPASIAFDSTTNRLFVADNFDNRVLQFSFITITTGSLGNGTAGTAYSATINTTSSQGDPGFFVTTGSLPLGLSLNASSGVISGTPTTAGTSVFTIEADDTTSTGMFYNRATYSVTIAAAPAAASTISPPVIGVGGGYAVSYGGFSNPITPPAHTSSTPTSTVAIATSTLPATTTVATVLPLPPPVSSPEFFFPKNLGLWDRGYDVGVLQVYLTSHASGPSGLRLKARGITGVFGLMTYRALQEFQASIGVRATGYLGPLTRAYFNR